MAHFGQATTYTPVDGDPVALVALWSPPATEEDTQREGRRLYRFCDVTLFAYAHPDYGGVAALSIRDSLSDAAGNEYAIANILEETSLYWKVRVSRSLVTARERHDRRRDKRQQAGRDPRRQL